MDSFCHRLSRVPQKFAAAKAIQNEKQDSYAVGYFKSNPEAKDTTPPERKLEIYEEQLNGDLENSERFVILVKQKAARYIVYGENSVEALRSHAAIGSWYNQNHRPESALRHLTRARQLEESREIDEKESIQIAVDTSEAYLSIKTERKSESAKNLNLASQAILPYEETEIDDLRLKYRRDLVLARISVLRGNHKKAVEHYEQAWNALDGTDGTDNEEGAILHSELADSLSIIGKQKIAGENYQRAFEIFTNLGMDKQAKRLERKLPIGGERNIEEESKVQPERTKLLRKSNFDHQPEPEPESKVEREIDRSTTPGLESEEKPSPEPESEEKLLPESESEERLSPEPESEEVPPPEPESEEKPSPEPESEEKPSPEPESEEKQSPEPESEEKPSPERDEGSTYNQGRDNDKNQLILDDYAKEITESFNNEGKNKPTEVKEQQKQEIVAEESDDVTFDGENEEKPYFSDLDEFLEEGLQDNEEEDEEEEANDELVQKGDEEEPLQKEDADDEYGFD